MAGGFEAPVLMLHLATPNQVNHQFPQCRRLYRNPSPGLQQQPGLARSHLAAADDHAAPCFQIQEGRKELHKLCSAISICCCIKLIRVPASFLRIEALEVGNWNGGEGGIRTPGSLRFNGFQDRRLKPLGHLSE
jgi:hypothetical protein